MILKNKAIKQLAEAVSDYGTQDVMTAGELLHSVRDSNSEYFNKVVEQSGMGLRKAYYLIQIAKQFGGLSIDHDRLNGIGWTKLMMIGPLVTAKTAEALLNLAESFTAHQLKAVLKGKSPVMNGRWVVLNFTPEQYEQFSAAILAQSDSKHGSGVKDIEAAVISALSKP